jgi:hypothetical protein
MIPSTLYAGNPTQQVSELQQAIFRNRLSKKKVYKIMIKLEHGQQHFKDKKMHRMAASLVCVSLL